jgi:hypothetical protein
MNTSKYFFQGFLFMFGLYTVPFLKDVKAENKISHYWEKVSCHIQKVFNAETTKPTK